PRTGRAGPRGWRLHAALRLCAPDDEGCSVQHVARLRSRGLRPLLCPPSPRGRDDQVDAAAPHRAGQRLAVSERAEYGEEGSNERRTFLRGIAATTAVTTLGRLRPAGAEPPPAPTRLRRRPSTED